MFSENVFLHVMPDLPGMALVQIGEWYLPAQYDGGAIMLFPDGQHAISHKDREQALVFLHNMYALFRTSDAAATTTEV